MQGLRDRRSIAGKWRVVLFAACACVLLAACGRTALYSNLDERQAN